MLNHHFFFSPVLRDKKNGWQFIDNPAVSCCRTDLSCYLDFEKDLVRSQVLLTLFNKLQVVQAKHGN